MLSDATQTTWGRTGVFRWVIATLALTTLFAGWMPASAVAVKRVDLSIYGGGTVEVNQLFGGSCSGTLNEDEPSTCTLNLTSGFGPQPTLSATPNRAWVFAGWEGECTKVEMTTVCQLPDSSDPNHVYRVTARFRAYRPEAGIDARPPVFTKATTASFSYHASSATDQRFLIMLECRWFLDGHPTPEATGSHGWQWCDWQMDPFLTRAFGSKTFVVAPGKWVFQVRGVNEAASPLTGFKGPIATAEWTVDTISPALWLNRYPKPRSTSTTAVFEIGGDEALASHRCRVYRRGSPPPSSYAGCDPSASFELDQGDYVFEGKATDLAGNESTIFYEWRIDSIGPALAITSAPAAQTRDTAALFGFDRHDATELECELDGSARPCGLTESPQYQGLGHGPHTFRLRGRDDFGNLTEVAHTWQVDLVAPETAIVYGPENGLLTNATRAVFALAASEPASFECRLDTAPFAPCVSSPTLTALGVGTHTFAVRAVDAVGNIDSSPAERAWRVTADLDGDGFPVGMTTDCDDTNPRINRGARDTPRDRIDQNCDGQDADWPYPPASFAVDVRPVNGVATLRRLTVKQLRRGDRIRVTCSGPACPRRSWTATRVRLGQRTIHLERKIGRVRFSRRAVLTVRVSAPDHATKLIRLIGTPRRATSTTRCERPRERPTRCW